MTTPAPMDTRRMTRHELADVLVHRLHQGTLTITWDAGREWPALVACLALKCIADPASRYAKALPRPA